MHVINQQIEMPRPKQFPRPNHSEKWIKRISSGYRRILDTLSDWFAVNYENQPFPQKKQSIIFWTESELWRQKIQGRILTPRTGKELINNPWGNMSKSRRSEDKKYRKILCDLVIERRKSDNDNFIREEDVLCDLEVNQYFFPSEVRYLDQMRQTNSAG